MMYRKKNLYLVSLRASDLSFLLVFYPKLQSSVKSGVGYVGLVICVSMVYNEQHTFTDTKMFGKLWKFGEDPEIIFCLFLFVNYVVEEKDNLKVEKLKQLSVLF